MLWSIIDAVTAAGVGNLRIAAAEPAPAATAAATPEPGVAAPAPDPRPDAGWQLYHDTFAR